MACLRGKKEVSLLDFASSGAAHIDTATLGMDTHPSSPRTELDLMTEQELARHLKICRRQLYNWRVGGLIRFIPSRVMT